MAPYFSCLMTYAPNYVDQIYRTAKPGPHAIPGMLKNIENLSEISIGPHPPGIYFLCDKSKRVVYIGQSIDAPTRVSHHLKSPGSEHFAEVRTAYFVPCPKQFLNPVEAWFIHQFQPKLNGTMKNGKKCSNVSEDIVMAVHEPPADV